MTNALIVHGGAPTAVINASLYGAIMEAKKSDKIDHFYAAIGGSGSILTENFKDMKEIPDSQLALLPYTPASAIGTSRDALEGDDYTAIAKVIDKYDIKYIFFNGGNGSMDTCGKIYKACKEIGVDVKVVGIPKTIDNDIAVTDHAPGFGSAARYIAATVSEISQDIRALPIHVSVVEAMGRNCGWITAASALSRSGDGDGPDLIYLPERAFDEDKFLADIERLWKEKHGGILVVASEGLRDKSGEPIVEPIFKVGRATYYGDVSAHLANLVIKKLGIKARSEKPGIAGRASIAFQSEVDRIEAEEAGRAAVRAALDGVTGVMVGFERDSTEPYSSHTVLIPIEKVMLEERVMPDNFINVEGNDVTPEFVEWCKPLIGGELRKFVTFK
jgi:6-phosphofructokinase 1